MDDRCIPEVWKSNLPQLKRNAGVRFVSLNALQPFSCLHKPPSVTSAQGIFAQHHYIFQEKGWDCSKKQQFYGRGSCLLPARVASTELNGLGWTWHRTEGRKTLQAGLPSENFNAQIAQTRFLSQVTVDFLCGSKWLPRGMGISLGNIPVSQLPQRRISQHLTSQTCSQSSFPALWEALRPYLEVLYLHTVKEK